VIDLFAGPGGLGEGFSRVMDPGGRPAFKIAASFEKDASAHQTLELRAFFRVLRDENKLDDYWAFTAGQMTRAELFQRHPNASRIATSESVLAELGSEAFPTQRLRETIRASLKDPSGPLVVVGGPPCQAYSIVGRARRKGITGYRAEDDHRTTLYKEYLQVLADWKPVAFVMENVRGILSSRLHGERIFPRILEDLSSPAEAIRRDGRTSLRGKCRYRIHSLVHAGDPIVPEQWVVRAEEYGIPQTRHRVILLGIREDIECIPGVLSPSPPLTVHDAIGDLPALRAEPTRSRSSPDVWLRCLEEASWLGEIDTDLRQTIANVLLDRSHKSDPGTGGLFRKIGRKRPSRSLADWIRDVPVPYILNHESRGHMAPDLQRYLFASVHGMVRGISPRLRDFPEALLPEHRNALDALEQGTFDDRFRVQLAGAPGTTVTSHISKDGHYFIHHDPVQCRSWTVREAARIQTFPDSYFFCGTRTAQYSQVGNAVPPMLAYQIATVIEDVDLFAS